MTSYLVTIVTDHHLTCHAKDKRTICSITSMIKDRIGRREVLLPINHNFNQIWIYKALFLKSRNSKIFFLLAVKKSHLSGRVIAGTVQLLRHGVYCPI